MPRFFFHLQCGASYADEHGTVLADQHDARKAALEIVSQLLRDTGEDLCRGDVFRVFAEDEQRAALFTIEVTLDHARAGRPSAAQRAAHR